MLTSIWQKPETSPIVVTKPFFSSGWFIADAAEGDAQAVAACHAIAGAGGHEADRASVLIGNFLDDGQSQSAAVHVAAQYAEEAVKHPLTVFWRNARARVFHFQIGRQGIAADTHSDPSRRLTVQHGIFNEIVK